MELEQLKTSIRKCNKCVLRKSCRGPVPPQGPAQETLFVITRNPSAEDDAAEIPLQGEVGKFLETIWEYVGIKRTDLLITDLVKCHVPDNKEPPGEAINICYDWLKKEINSTKPRLIVTLGALAAETLTKTTFVPENVVSLDWKFSDLVRGIIVITLYHPGYILREQDKELEKIYRDSWDKTNRLWVQLKAQIDDPLAKKQFLKF